MSCDVSCCNRQRNRTCGSKTSFVDANAIDGNIRDEAVKEAIGPRTVGIAVVHFNGAPADLITIRNYVC